MSLETKRERIIYLGLVPVLAAVLGALATAIFQAANTPSGDFPTALQIMQDKSLSGPDKIKLIEMVKEVSDRPWSVIRSLMTTITFLAAFCAAAIATRIAGR